MNRLARIEPRYILNNFSNVHIIHRWAAPHYAQAASGLTSSSTRFTLSLEFFCAKTRICCHIICGRRCID